MRLCRSLLCKLDLPYLAFVVAAHFTCAENKKQDLFISYRWRTAQDQARIVKLQIQSLVNNARIFLDLDNLGSTSDLETHVEASGTFLAILTGVMPHSSI